MGNRKESHVTKQKFDEFVLAHGRDILWFCRMTAENAHEGDELYQDTMLTLLEHLDRLDEKNNSKSYALSVAIWLWKNRRRKFAWRMRIAPQESYEVHIQNGGEASETRNADPEVQVLQEETIHEVQKLVQQLPEKYRLVVYLYYSADMKLTEIAECLHLSVNTVKTRLRKAKSLLKEKLEVIGYER